ncbi:hypothetical protein HELRODRAFT_193651 [Helobdella robusta]|uniref:PID domain-containing protein n=1 Tax=Helobdella robusta TaxID=6412 RepID=T1FV81_HELRO|nr:hypothetical protein HELRODRAFT_193651 [Helobdella robusta]ESN95138.1 hypothetical protein HELRODRAFT_193651 [Helobdella robusta]
MAGYIPLVKCRVLYLGSSIPIETSVGLEAVQHPLRERYGCSDVDGGRAKVSGIDSTLTVYSSGILLQYMDDPTACTWFPIQTLHVCCSVKPVRTGYGCKFVPTDSLEAAGSVEPPIFAAITRRAKGIKVLECHAFITKTDETSFALVQSCTHAFQHREGWLQDQPPIETLIQTAARLIPAEKAHKARNNPDVGSFSFRDKAKRYTLDNLSLDDEPRKIYLEDYMKPAPEPPRPKPKPQAQPRPPPRPDPEPEKPAPAPAAQPVNQQPIIQILPQTANSGPQNYPPATYFIQVPQPAASAPEPAKPLPPPIQVVQQPQQPPQIQYVQQPAEPKTQYVQMLPQGQLVQYQKEQQQQPAMQWSLQPRVVQVPNPAPQPAPESKVPPQTVIKAYFSNWDDTPHKAVMVSPESPYKEEPAYPVDEEKRKKRHHHHHHKKEKPANNYYLISTEKQQDKKKKKVVKKKDKDEKEEETYYFLKRPQQSIKIKQIDESDPDPAPAPVPAPAPRKCKDDDDEIIVYYPEGEPDDEEEEEEEEPTSTHEIRYGDMVLNSGSNQGNYPQYGDEEEEGDQYDNAYYPPYNGGVIVEGGPGRGMYQAQVDYGQMGYDFNGYAPYNPFTKGNPDFVYRY